MVELASGQRVDLGEGRLTLAVGADRAEGLRDCDLLLAAFDEGGRPSAELGVLAAGGRDQRGAFAFRDAHTVELDLHEAPASLGRLVAVLHAPRGVRPLGRVTLSLDGWRFAPEIDERFDAVVLGEVYRRQGRWRWLASGQGFLGGLTAASAALGVELRGRRREPESGQDVSRPPSSGGGGASSGSGFAVGRRRILTNHHVIEDASRVRVVGDDISAEATVLAMDPRNDIALLGVDRDLGEMACFRDGFDLDLGEDVVVLGFPLQGLLSSGPQVTGGNVSALSGVFDDHLQFQFTAPIASGASGGPVLDSAGRVIGLVRATLNHDEVRRGGNTAENVNFAVKTAAVRAFLNAAGVTPACVTSGAPRGRAEVAREARRFLYRVRCES